MKTFRTYIYLILLFSFFRIATIVAQNTFYGTGTSTGIYGYNSGFGYNSFANFPTDMSVGQGNSGLGAYSLLNMTGGNFNVAVGDSTLCSLDGSSTTGSGNVAVGGSALKNSTDAILNVAVGLDAQYLNTTGGQNVGVGDGALYANTTGADNVAVGGLALYTSTTGTGSTAIGFSALHLNSSNEPNDAFGYNTLHYSTTGQNNAAFGYEAAENTTTGSYNAAFGYQALLNNTTGGDNNAYGYQAQYNATGSTANYNDAFGYEASYENSGGAYNDAFGYNALYNNTSSDNCAFGYLALYNSNSNSMASANSAFGWEALEASTSGNLNTAIGEAAGVDNTSGSYNTFVGADAGNTNTSTNNSTFLGYGAGPLSSTGNDVYLGNTSIGGIIAEVTTITAYSDARIKDNVKENVPGLSFITQLRPVTYNLNIHRQNEILYKGKPDTTNWEGKYDIEKIQQTGFIAQDVEKAAEKAGYDFSGLKRPKSANDLYGLKYSDFVVPLVKSVQEQQGMIETMQETIAQQQELLTTALNQLEDMKECCNNASGNNVSSPASAPQLFNAVPNPTSGSSVIYYFVPQTSKTARIQLTDANGTVLQTISAINLGYSSITIPTGNLASGIYQYSLIVDEALIDTKELSVILK